MIYVQNPSMCLLNIFWFAWNPGHNKMSGSALVHLAAPNLMSFILGAKKLGCPNILEIKLSQLFLFYPLSHTLLKAPTMKL